MTRVACGGWRACDRALGTAIRYNHLAADVRLEALVSVPTLLTLDLERNALGDAAANRLASTLRQASHRCGEEL